MSSTYIVAFCGLPSSGKSTLINSLIGERLLHSGVCRTTTNVNTLEDEIITDDNGNKFIVIDLPGICDSEENDKKFNEMTEAHITNANLICFVSDVNKAFITTHEVNEYKKIKKIVKDLEKDNGQIYDVAIILSKCDFKDECQKKKIDVENSDSESDEPEINSASKKNTKTREIYDSDEDTDLGDLVKKVKEKMPDEDIILFNAFGRIKYNNKISSNLKKLVKKSGVNLTDNNISFSINKYCNEIQKRQELSFVEKFNERKKLYLENEIQFDKVINSYNNMNHENGYYWLLDLADAELNFKYFKLVDFILTNNEEILIEYSKSKFSEFYVKYYFKIINENCYSKERNLTKDFDQTTIFDLIETNFSDSSFEYKNKVFDDIIFKDCVFTDIRNSVSFLNKCHIQHGGFEKYNFYNKFNDFIKACDTQIFNKFHRLISSYCDPICFPVYSSKGYTLSDNTQIITAINKYLEDLTNQINDPKYILYNKLQILKYLLYNPNESTKQTFHFKETKLKGNIWTEQKIINHPEYKKLQNFFYSKFLGDILIPYEKEEDIVFVSLDEILYLKNKYEII